MKSLIRYIFSPLFRRLEAGSEPYEYKPSYRKILLVIGGLFTGLALAVLWLAKGQDPAYLFPVIIFGGAGLLSLLVGLLGSDRAVAKIWGSR